MESASEGFFPVQVSKRTEEALGICSLELVSVDGQRLPSFEAGAHVELQIAVGTIRHYSLCNSPAESHRYEIAVLKDPNSRGGSVWVHDNVRLGDQVFIRGPINRFALAENPRGGSLLFAGGIGITPLLSMAEALSSVNGDFALHYCARSAQQMAFRERIERASFAQCVTFHLDDAPADQRLDVDAVIRGADPKAHIYVCGPSGFIDHVFEGAKRAGWEPSSLHCEHFSGSTSESGRPFRIKIAHTGESYLVPADKTVIEVLAENGIVIPVSCEQGVCGTCITKVIAGDPDHRDRYLTPAERAKKNQFMPCVSRAMTDELLIDLQ
jgi:vanillate O-demethylase ferredoxin subunit